MRRHDTYCSNFSCTPVTLAAGLHPGARRAMGLPSNRSRSVTKSAVPTDRSLSPFDLDRRKPWAFGPPKVMKNGFCFPEATSHPPVIPAGAQRSGGTCGSTALSWKCFSAEESWAFGSPKVMKKGSCSAATVPGGTTHPFVISTEAKRSGEISVWMLLLGNVFRQSAVEENCDKCVDTIPIAAGKA
jgi:hypothetical protein